MNQTVPPTFAKLVYQLDYVDNVSSQTIKLLDQDGIAFLHLELDDVIQSFLPEVP